MKRSYHIVTWPLLLLLLLLSCSCTGAPVTFRTTASQPVDRQQGRSIAAEACGFQLLLFIPIMTNNRQERAYQALLGQANGELLGEVKVKESWAYGLVGTVYCTRLEAMVYPQMAKVK